MEIIVEAQDVGVPEKKKRVYFEEACCWRYFQNQAKVSVLGTQDQNHYLSKPGISQIKLSLKFAKNNSLKK